VDLFSSTDKIVNLWAQEAQLQNFTPESLKGYVSELKTRQYRSFKLDKLDATTPSSK